MHTWKMGIIKVENCSFLAEVIEHANSDITQGRHLWIWVLREIVPVQDQLK